MNCIFLSTEKRTDLNKKIDLKKVIQSANNF